MRTWMAKTDNNTDIVIAKDNISMESVIVCDEVCVLFSSRNDLAFDRNPVRTVHGKIEKLKI